jgi:hypothetical protein
MYEWGIRYMKDQGQKPCCSMTLDDVDA